MPFWFDEIFAEQNRFGVKAQRTLFAEKSPFQHIEIVQTEGFGRVLALDGMFMASERDEHLYHEMLVHPALTTAEAIRRVLVIGGGDGGTVREVLSYTEVERVVMVEIDGLVVEACQAHLPGIGTAWGDPRLEVVIGDGIDYALNAKVEPYDVILLDGSDPVGPAEGLFSAEFYRGCARLLAEHGVFALQSESPFAQRKTFLELGATLSSVFPRVHPYFGVVPIYVCGQWSWTFASRSVDPFAIVESRAERAEARCKHYNRDIHRAAFAIPNDLKRHFRDGRFVDAP